MKPWVAYLFWGGGVFFFMGALLLFRFSRLPQTGWIEVLTALFFLEPGIGFGLNKRSCEKAHSIFYGPLAE